ncbi:MAG: hypothetical protein ABUL64_00145 [Singulisphaera sp.]
MNRSWPKISISLGARLALCRTAKSIVAALIVYLTIVGCSHKPSPQLDTDPMAKPVTQLADGAENPKLFKRLFVADAVPDEKARRRYSECMFIVTEVNPRSDAEAELRVRILGGDGNERGTMSWTVVKEEAGRWKLKSAPLP